MHSFNYLIIKKIAFSLFFALSAATISFAGESIQPSASANQITTVKTENVIYFEDEEDVIAYCMNTSFQTASGGSVSGTICAETEAAWYSLVDCMMEL
jgi:hypothetical protein